MSLIKNEQGLVALQHRTSNPATVQIGETSYTWEPRHNVSLAWVKPEHVDGLLLILARICCGKTAPKFYPATQVNINLWQTGNRHGT